MNQSDRGVSPVISVILLTAIVVVLATTLGAFVISMVGDSSPSPSARVSISEFDNGDGSRAIQVEIRSMGTADAVYIAGPSVDGEKQITGADNSSDPGDVGVVSGLERGDRVNIVASAGGERVVIQTYRIRGG